VIARKIKVSTRTVYLARRVFLVELTARNRSLKELTAS